MATNKGSHLQVCPLNFQFFCQMDGAHLVEIESDRENSFLAAHARSLSGGNNIFSLSLLCARWLKYIGKQNDLQLSYFRTYTQTRSQNVEKVKHINGRLQDQANILLNCDLFQNGNLLLLKEIIRSLSIYTQRERIISFIISSL